MFYIPPVSVSCQCLFPILFPFTWSFVELTHPQSRWNIYIMWNRLFFSFSVRDFDVNLYLCNGAFQFLASDFTARLSQTGYVFYLYCVYHVVGMLLLVRSVFVWWRYVDKQSWTASYHTRLLHREMDVWMYVCVGSFKYLGTDTYARMTSKLVFPLYFLYQVGGVLAVVSGVLKVWR